MLVKVFFSYDLSRYVYKALVDNISAKHFRANLKIKNKYSGLKQQNKQSIITTTILSKYISEWYVFHFESYVNSERN